MINLVIVSIVTRQAFTSALLPPLLACVVVVGVSPTCLCHRRPFLSACTIPALVSIAETIRLPARVRSPCHTLDTEPTVGCRLVRVTVKASMDSVMSDFSTVHLGQPGHLKALLPKANLDTLTRLTLS